VIASVTDSLGLNIQVPHPARVYDFWLGGKDNFEARRRAAAEAIEIFPKTVQSARSCRDFLSRAVGYLTAEAGIRQFLDLGSGLPSAANVHEVAQSIAPESRGIVARFYFQSTADSRARARISAWVPSRPPPWARSAR
jgi:hypothetical protein